MVIFWAFLYIIIGAISTGADLNWRTEGRYLSCKEVEDMVGGAVFIGLCWPVTMPFRIAINLAIYGVPEFLKKGEEVND